MAWEYWYRFFDLCREHLTQEEDEEYPKRLPFDLICKLIERCHDKLVGLAFAKNSRLAFQVLGGFLMSHGAKMTVEVKKLILKNSRWIDDSRQLKKKKDKIERRKYLFDFKEKVIRYKGGEPVKIPIESVTDVVKQTLKSEGRKIPNVESYIQRTPIID